jgi:outer membrane protein OmpA-like peptidoglycan-associated protein
MSQNSVIKLKELLFDKESHEINALTARLAEIAERAGSDVHFRRSVTASLEGALRDAEASQHRQVADALAPLVIRTVRTEVEANSDTLPAKLYPHIGIMVRDYVRSAIRDLMEDLNQRLEDGLTKNRFALRLKSWTTGRSMAELALAGGRRFHVDELHLIRRGSGELLAHWTRPDINATPQPDGRDALFSGMLTAMTAFIEEVYEADKAGLRSIDFGGHTIYLRGSPHHLLAAKCHGEAGPGIETLLDEEFLRALQTERTAGAASANGAAAPTPHDLATLAARLEAGIAERQKLRGDRGRSRLRPLRILLWLIALALAALFGWYGYTAYQRHTVQSAVDRVIAETPALKGYPTKAVVSGTGEHIEISGLAPSGDIRTDVLGRIRNVAPRASITETIGVVPGAESATFAQQISQLREQLTAVQVNLEKLTATASGMAQAAAVEQQLQAIRSDIETLKPKPDPRADLEQWMRNHAIFFSEDTNFHDPRATDAALDALATLMRRTDATIRIVGFTDERGTSDRNLPLAYARAEKVVAELTRRGVNAARLTKVARASVLDISPGSGPSSPNRRVTFETVFVGEGR